MVKPDQWLCRGLGSVEHLGDQPVIAGAGSLLGRGSQFQGAADQESALNLRQGTSGRNPYTVCSGTRMKSIPHSQ